jgi:hypothetical protein
VRGARSWHHARPALSGIPSGDHLLLRLALPRAPLVVYCPAVSRAVDAPAPDSSAARWGRRALRVVVALALVAAIALLLTFAFFGTVVAPIGCEDADLAHARMALCNSGGPGAGWRTAGYLTSLSSILALFGAIVHAAIRRKVRVLAVVIVLGFLAQFAAAALLEKEVNPNAKPALRLDPEAPAGA